MGARTRWLAFEKRGSAGFTVSTLLSPEPSGERPGEGVLPTGRSPYRLRSPASCAASWSPARRRPE
jgi:hypothetical protein